MKKSSILFLSGLVIILVGVLFWPHPAQTPGQGSVIKQDLLPKKVLTLPNDSQLTVMLAQTEEDRVRGLSGYPKLSNGEGMLFIFPQEDIHGIWMKDMNFPLDILWLDGEQTIVHLVQNAMPESYPDTVFFPDAPARFVIELVSGEISRHDLKVGQKITW